MPSYSSGTHKTRDRTNPPVTSKILSEIVRRWGPVRTRWAIDLLFDDLYNWNTWLYANRREAPLGLFSWGSNPYPYAPDATSTSAAGCGGGCANLESGLDNGPVMDGVPFNASGLYLQDEYDAGLTGLFLMDCAALAGLADLIGRAPAAAELRRRAAAISPLMLRALWNESAAFFGNVRSADGSMIKRMAPTAFYPLLAGTPTTHQVAATVTQHLTNPQRFAVWPSGHEPHGTPDDGSRPLLQWISSTAATGGRARHTLCCQLSCNYEQRDLRPPAAMQRLAFEGVALASPGSRSASELTALFTYECGANSTSGAANGTNRAIAPAGWVASRGGPCHQLERSAEMWTFATADAAKPSPSAHPRSSSRRAPPALLRELELWYSADAADFFALASDTSRAAAAAVGYEKVASLGFVWPPPGSADATARYPLPAVTKDDPSYIDQSYWRGRAWAPMIQIVYWALRQYDAVPEARGAADGLAAQAKALLLKEWDGYGGDNAFAGTGRYVYENFDPETGEGYGFSSEAQPMYSWGALAGFVGMQHAGYYGPLT